MPLVCYSRVLALFIFAVMTVPAFADEGPSDTWPPSLRDLRAVPAEPVQDSRAKTEAGVAAEDCNCSFTPSGNPVPILRDLRGIAAGTNEYANESPFLADLKKRISTGSCKDTKLACSRDLIQIPLKGRGFIGPCGSHHYTPDPPPGVDAYAEPVAACAFTAVLQEWKKNVCPERSGCTIEWGDISHKTKPYFNTHKDHTSGDCIDIRPLRVGEFVDGGMTIRSSAYNRKKTKQLVELLQKMGASTIYFNDPAAGGSSMPRHNDHIHVCFKNTGTVAAVCNNLKVDTNICPELQ